jgi:hypothetical protein
MNKKSIINNKAIIKLIKMAIKELKKSTGYVTVPAVTDNSYYYLVQKGNIIIHEIELNAMINMALEAAGVTHHFYYVSDRYGKIQEAINYLQGLLNVKR